MYGISLFKMPEICIFISFKAPKPYILLQRALAQDLRVQNMREGFWEFTQPVTVAGFGRTKNNPKDIQSDAAKVHFFLVHRTYRQD